MICLLSADRIMCVGYVWNMQCYPHSLLLIRYMISELFYFSHWTNQFPFYQCHTTSTNSQSTIRYGPDTSTFIIDTFIQIANILWFLWRNVVWSVSPRSQMRRLWPQLSQTLCIQDSKQLFIWPTTPFINLSALTQQSQWNEWHHDGHLFSITVNTIDWLCQSIIIGNHVNHVYRFGTELHRHSTNSILIWFIVHKWCEG